LDGYLSYWADLNIFVLDSIPSERLLVVHTYHIAENMNRFADFAGVPVDQLDNRKAYSHKTIKKHKILEKIDSKLIAEKMYSICQPVVERLNRIQSIEDYDFLGLPK
jgi:hypothetical protein